MKIINLCEDKKCSGCGACRMKCPKVCISMKENLQGELHPVVDRDCCINCGLCTRVCHINNEVPLFKPFKCYAAVRKNKSDIARCASGGVGTLLMQEALNIGFSVFATRYDENLMPKVCEFHNIEEIDAFKGSKYVQSQVGDSYCKIKTILNNGKSVLFIGTPCQIAGLKVFLGKDYENLICCDLFCHGVVPTLYFKEELSFLQLERSSDISFRGWEIKEDYWFIVWKDGKKVFAQPGNINYYVKSFYDNIALRESCYNCRYSCDRRCGDLSIGDFLGLEKGVMSNYKNNCVTAILINTRKGSDLFNIISNLLEVTERPVEEAINGGRSLQHAAIESPLRTKFKKNYVQDGYSKAIRKTLRYEMVRAKYKRYIEYIKRRICKR